MGFRLDQLNHFTRRDTLTAAGALGLTGMLAPLAAAYTDTATRESEWWCWRGPRGNNHAAPGSAIPAENLQQRVVWSAQLPGRGHSSPIVAGDAVYLTTAEKQAGTQSVLAVGRDGKARWSRVVHQGGIPADNHQKNTEASPTPAFDGEHLFASFYNSGAIRLTSLTIDGQVRWQTEVGQYQPQQYKYGYAASPLIHGDLVIVAGDYDGFPFLAAIDRATGQQRWKTRRPSATSFSSPIIGRVAGRDQLLLSGANMVAGYDPESGLELWKSNGATTMATCGTMVWDDQRVFASGGYPEPETVCVAADGSGRVLWSNRTKCYEQSLLVDAGLVFAVADNGVAYCWNASDGKGRWRQRLGGAYSSSPLLVGDAIHIFNEAGQGFAFAASPQFKALGQSQLGDEVFASPVVVDNTMYVRIASNTPRGRQESLLAIR